MIEVNTKTIEVDGEMTIVPDYDLTGKTWSATYNEDDSIAYIYLIDGEEV